MLLFINNNLKQLKRQWLSLPLLLLFPFLLVGIIALLLFIALTPSAKAPVTIGIVDENQSEETKLLTNLLVDAPVIAEHISMKLVTREQAEEQLTNDIIRSYMIFPTNFTQTLYEGEPATLTIIANPAYKQDAALVKQVSDTIASYMNYAQANLSMINDTAHAMQMADDARRSLIQREFTAYFMLLFSREQFISTTTIENIATAKPLYYYATSIVFITALLWLLLLNQRLVNETPNSLQTRMRMFGVGITKPLLARLLVATSLAVVLSFGSSILAKLNSDLYWLPIDYVRVLLVLTLTLFIYASHLAILELMLPSTKLTLLAQVAYTLLIIAMSGALLPSSYLPFTLPFFTTEAFTQLVALILYERLYTNYLPLLLTLGISLAVCSVLLYRRERAA